MQCSNLGHCIFLISSASPCTFWSLDVGKIIIPPSCVIFLKNRNTDELNIQSKKYSESIKGKQNICLPLAYPIAIDALHFSHGSIVDKL